MGTLSVSVVLERGPHPLVPFVLLHSFNVDAAVSLFKDPVDCSLMLPKWHTVDFFFVSNISQDSYFCLFTVSHQMSYIWLKSRIEKQWKTFLQCVVFVWIFYVPGLSSGFGLCSSLFYSHSFSVPLHTHNTPESSVDSKVYTTQA